jgi:hypothetical protein
MLTPPLGWYRPGFFLLETEGGTRFQRPGLLDYPPAKARGSPAGVLP